MFRSAKSRLAGIAVAAACGVTLLPVPAIAQTSGASPAPFDVPPDSRNASGSKFTVLDLKFEVLDLKFEVLDFVSTVEALDGSSTVSESATETDIALSSDVLFEFGKADLTPAANALLDEVAGKVKDLRDRPVRITGFTDSIGTDAVNIPLSRARAEAVSVALTARTGRNDFAVDGKGSAQPVAPNTNADGSDNPAGRAKNRRVQVEIAR